MYVVNLYIYMYIYRMYIAYSLRPGRTMARVHIYIYMGISTCTYNIEVYYIYRCWRRWRWTRWRTPTGILVLPLPRIFKPCPPPHIDLYKNSFTPKLSCTSQSSFHCPIHLHCSHYCNAIARLMRNIRPPANPAWVCHTPYNIGSGNIV